MIGQHLLFVVFIIAILVDAIVIFWMFHTERLFEIGARKNMLMCLFVFPNRKWFYCWYICAQKICCIVIYLEHSFSALALLTSCAGWFFFLHEEVYVNFKISGRTLILCCKYQWYHHLKLWQLKLPLNSAISPLGENCPWLRTLLP